MALLDVLPEVDWEAETITWPDPCAGEDACLSKQELPAEWLWTHQEGNPGCAQVFCSKCDVALQVLVEIGIKQNGGWFACKHCGKDKFPKSSLVRRHI